MPPYKYYLALNIFFNILASVLTLFSFALIIPILEILFKLKQASYTFMEWGIVRGNDLYMYGDKLKASLIKGAGENVFTTASRAVSENTSKNTKYPNPVTGWGTLCLLDSIP